jgi:hypothetical protein
MASSSSSASISFSIPVTEKLTCDSFLVWRAQVLPAVHGAHLVGLLNGSVAMLATTIQIEKADKSKEDVEKLPTSIGCHRINKCCHISSPPYGQL